MSATKNKDSMALKSSSKDYSKTKSYQDDKKSYPSSDKNSSYNYTKNSRSDKRADSKSVIQNNINIGTMVGNLHLGPSMTMSGKR